MPTAEDRKLIKETDRLKKYVARFGWQLAGFDPGIWALTKDGASLRFDDAEWRAFQDAINQAEADGFKRGRQNGLEEAAVFEETVCLEDGKLVQHTKDEASIEQQLKAEAIRSRKEKPDAG